ncbi:hypothetical protein [Fodinicola acaciae]|uniref:hypothetical protein n=1 Tax=Fodinicola acaciae TaxID=2681555 RepID=UPI0013D152B0|nr:hypothetical protein [Fodinicola acaciae]
MRRLRARTAIVVALALSVLLIGATTAPATAATVASSHAVVHVQQAAAPAVHADNPPVPGLPPLPVPGGLPNLGDLVGTVMGLLTSLLKTVTGLLGSVLPVPLPALPLPK